MKFTFTRGALIGAVALSLMAATVAVVKKTSDYPRVTTPGTNDLFLLAVPNPTNGLFGTGSTNNAVTYANLKAAINAANQPASANLSNWSALATSAKQPASANLTNWSALATSAKQDALGYTPQPASANLTNWSAIATNAMVNGTGSPNTLAIWSGTNLLAYVINGVGILTNDGAGGFGFTTNLAQAITINNFSTTSLTTSNFYTVNGNHNTLIVSNMVTFGQAALTYATNVLLNFDTQAYKTLTATGNVTFATTNLGPGKSVTVKILASAFAPTVAFPAWTFLGSAAPTSLATNKTAVFTVTAFGTADTNCVAAYAAEP
jgi:hypothetical protein